MLATLLVLAGGGGPAWATGPAPPRGWPATLQLGGHDVEHGAAALRADAPLQLRYHYLSGGVNTGRGWQTFARGGGTFVGGYVADSQAHGFDTVFSYYMLLQSAPGNLAAQEDNMFVINLRTPATMRAWFEDLRTFYRRAAATGADPIVLHVEPDLWGYAQRRGTGDDARTPPASVASSGIPELAGLPNDVAGVARAVVRLRDRYAPNVLLAYPVSVWGTGNDISSSDHPDTEVDALADRSSAYYRSLAAGFDILFFEFADRDAGYREHVDGVGRAGWWDAEDFHRNQRYVGRMTSTLGLPGVMWQIPLGNTVMRAMNNTRGHYQDNRVETLLDPSRVALERYRDAGIVALLFGPALPGATCACDATGDGVTDPAPINGNIQLSLSADDDGGFFDQRVREYYARGALSLTPSAPAPPVPPPATPSPPVGPSPDMLLPPSPPAAPAAVAPPSPGPAPMSPTVVKPAPPKRFSPRLSVRQRHARRGRKVRLLARVWSRRTTRATVIIEVRGPVGRGSRRQLRKSWTLRSFGRLSTRSFTLDWRVPRQARTGRYTVRVQVLESRQARTGRPVSSGTTRLTVRR